MEQATIEKPNKINAHIVIRNGEIHYSDNRLEGLDKKKHERILIEATVIEQYKEGKIGYSDIAGILGFSSSQKAKEWLQSKGIETVRMLTPDMEDLQDRNMEEARKILGIK